MKGKLFLIPTTLGESDLNTVIPLGVQAIIENCKHFIVEDLKSARRYLKRVNREIIIEDLTFFILNKHTEASLLSTYIEPLKEGHNIGIISEAGCPAVADPGSDIVALAHEKNYEIIPLVGPSSILMGLMASGFNGQQFTFHGYLPKDNHDRKRKVLEMEKQALLGHTQIFMETPFRNQSLLNDLLHWCDVGTKVCIATDITLPSETIKTRAVKQWQINTPNISKRYCMFLMGK